MSEHDPKGYLDPAHLRRLRQVLQGRVTREHHGPTRGRGAGRDYWAFHVDNERASDIADLNLLWLHDNGYIEHPGASQGDEWVLVRTTDFGDEVLAAYGADYSAYPPLHDLTAAEARGLVAGLHTDSEAS